MITERLSAGRVAVWRLICSPLILIVILSYYTKLGCVVQQHLRTMFAPNLTGFLRPYVLERGSELGAYGHRLSLDLASSSKSPSCSPPRHQDVHLFLPLSRV